MNILFSKILSINLFVVFLLLGGTHNSTSNPEWELISEDKTTQIYTRKTDQSPIKEIRVVSQFNSDIETFREVLGDVDGYPSWVFKCMGSEKLETENDREFHYYLMTDMPYPVSNRDLIVYTKNWNRNNTYFSQSIATPNFLSEKEGLVRVPKFASLWKVTPTSNQTIQIEYEAATDPGGYIPNWVINLGITKGPSNTIKSLKKQVEKKYLAK